MWKSKEHELVYFHLHFYFFSFFSLLILSKILHLCVCIFLSPFFVFLIFKYE